MSTNPQHRADSPASPLVEIDGLHVTLQGQDILRDIHLNVLPGETLAIIGESGCGKTVLLKSMAALIQPTRGNVRFDGQDLSQLGERELSRQRMRYGFVFQSAALFDSLTVGQNVAFPLREKGITAEDQIREIVNARLGDVGLPATIVRKKPAELSGGMRKRVGLARALAVEPELVLYDEPTTGLDPIMSDVINELILSTHRRHHVTSVVVTHNMHTVQKVADRVVMLYPLTRLSDDEPQILFDGPPADLEASKDRRVRQFVRGEAGERLNELREGA